MKALSLILMLLTTGLFAQTNWHVAMNGSDATGNGSMNQPYATLKKAGTMVQAGDTVFVHQGTYYNKNFGDGDIWKTDDLMYLSAHGSPDNYIVFMPYQNDHVVLKSDGKFAIRLKNASYIKVTGFEFEGIGQDITQAMADAAWGLYKDANGVVHDLAVELNIDINDPTIRGTTISKPVLDNIKKPSYYNGRGLVCAQSHHIVFSNNIIHDFPASGLRADKSSHVTITNNTIYYNTYWTSVGVGALTVAVSNDLPNGDTSTSVKIKVQKNYVHHNENRLISWNPSKNFIHMVIDEGSGIFFTRNADTYHYGKALIANNISAFNGASGIVIHKTDRAIVEFNTVYKNGTTNDGAPAGIGMNNVNEVTIRNNISYVQPDHWAMGKVGGSLNNVTITNNIIYNENGSELVYHNIPNTGFTITNPLLIDPDNGDFRLQANSPAIDAGIVSTYTNDDYLSQTRDANPDIGAYEFAATGITEYTSLNLQVYPNPAIDYINLKGNLKAYQKISVYDLTGKILISVKLNADKQKITLPLYTLKSGIYLLKSGNFKHLFIKK